MIGSYWIKELKTIPAIKEVRGRGLIIGFDLPEEKTTVRTDLLFKHFIFTGEAKPNTIRLLPSLAMTKEEADLFLTALKEQLK
jgi:acetylornithine/N-succinyldiaminopimelate aminotransferase